MNNQPKKLRRPTLGSKRGQNQKSTQNVAGGGKNQHSKPAVKESHQSTADNEQRHKTRHTQSEHRELHILLERDIAVKRYPVIAKVTFRRERPDLVALLREASINSQGLPPRLKSYLSRVNLFSDEQLTNEGEQVLETGFFEVQERGLYHIWYTDNDPLLKTVPLFIQRDTAFFDPDSKSWKSGVDAATSEFRLTDEREVQVLEERYNGQRTEQSHSKLTVISLEPEVICSYEAQSQLHMTWQLSLAGSSIRLKGKLDVLSFEKNKVSVKPEHLDLNFSAYDCHFPDVMSAIAGELDGQWDQHSMRMRLRGEPVLNYPQALQRFTIATEELSNLECFTLGRYKAKVDQLPVKPMDDEDAEQWHNHWLEAFFQAQFRSSEQSWQEQARWLDHDAMVDFDLPLKTGLSLLNTFQRQGGQQTAYWRVAAVADLSPAFGQKQFLPITLINGDSLDIRSFIGQLSGNRAVDQVIYSDRYTSTSKQGRHLRTMAKHLDAAKGVLMTLKAPSQLPDEWDVDIIDKHHDNHGRYWVFIGNNQTICWECSCSLDFIGETAEGYVVEGTPSFTPKTEHELPEYLQDAIRQITAEEVI